MIINQNKTKFMVVNATANDKAPLRIKYGDAKVQTLMKSINTT